MTLFNKKAKFGYIVALSFILLGLFVLGCIVIDSQKKENSIPVVIQIKNEESTEEIIPWRDKAGMWYFFIPSYVNVQNASLYPKERGCYLQNNPLSGELILDNIEMGVEYNFEQKTLFSSSKTSIIFMQSANVSTMYIRTVTGKMDLVYRDKEYKESANVEIFDENGKASYIGKGKDSIKGHGNSTWLLKKKPLMLELSNESNILGMESSSNWLLLANGYDETNLRNKLIYDYASNVNCGWTPHCEYVDLYLNGEYNGLYLLSEKVEVSDKRLSINNLKNDYLFEGIQEIKIKEKDITFNISDDKYFKLDYPYTLDKNKDLAEIQQNVYKLDEEITSGDLSRIDMDSWVRRYLIDEVFINPDAIQASSYYCYDSDKDKFIAGPIWDYDLAFGNDASEWTKKSRIPEQILGVRRYWYKSLYKNDVFYNDMRQVYQKEFLPELERMLEEDLPNMKEKILKASVCNSIRWNEMFKKSYAEDAELDERVNGLSEFLERRIAYLDTIWGADVRLAIDDAELDVKLPDTTSKEATAVANNENGNVEISYKEQISEWIKEHDSLLMFMFLCGAFVLLGIRLVHLDIKRYRKGGTDERA